MAAAQPEGAQWALWREWMARPLCYHSMQWKSEHVVEREGKWAGRCSGCGIVHYKTPAWQRQHWKLHKKVCGKPDFARIGALSAEQCAAELDAQLTRGRLTKDLAALVYRVRHLLKGDDADEDATDGGELGLALHTMTRIHGLPEVALSALYASIWAAPGMAHLLLLEEHTSRASRAMAAAVAAAAPGEIDDELEYRLDYARCSDTGASELAFLTFNLLVRTAVGGVQPSHTSTSDGAGVLRKTPIAVAAARRAVQLWMDPEVRNCCGDALAPAASFVVTLTAVPSTLESGPIEAARGRPSCSAPARWTRLTRRSSAATLAPATRDTSCSGAPQTSTMDGAPSGASST